MSDRKRPSGAISATELMAQLQADPDYQARVAAEEAEREVRAQELDRAEQPIVADLRAVGVEIKSVWDLVNTSEPYPAALPVLMEHLRAGGYPDRVMESLGRALAVGPSAPQWYEFRGLYLAAQGHGEEEGLAVALAASATSEHLDDLISLLGEDSRSDTRIHFLRPIKRVGGQRGREVLESLREDPFYGREAKALLKSRRS